MSCNGGGENENNFGKSIGSYSNYINRKKVGVFLSNGCTYPKNYNTVNLFKFYVQNSKCRKSVNGLPLPITFK